MAKAWRVVSHDQLKIAELCQRADVSPLVAQLLLSRGIVEESAVRIYLDAKLDQLRDPELLPGLSQAADYIIGAVQAGRSICVYGDYDADGMTASSILLRCLRMLGADVSVYVPNRLEDGYGLSHDAIRKLHERGKQLIVTVDCGICSVEEAELCRELGIDLVVTDHHQFGDRLPDCKGIIHPALPGTNYPFHGLCGAGVAFKLSWALCQRASQSKRVSPELRQFLLEAIGLAAIGTIADVVPLSDENRIIVRHGLRAIAQTKLPGLRALMGFAKIAEKQRLSSEDIGFSLAPRLNAAGRLGQAQLGVELLATDDPDRAQALAEYIHQLNGTRETLERSMYLAAVKQAKEQFDPEADPALVLAAPGWHAGIIGVVAGRLAEKFDRPVIIIALDQVGAKPGLGSARSAGRVNLHEALNACREYLISCGGHAAAAGLRVEESKLPAFREAFCEYVAEQSDGEEEEASITLDAEAPFGQLTIELIEQLDQMAPFGSGNPRPLLCATGVSLAEPPKTMGQGDRHFSARFVQHGTSMRAVAFGQAEWVESMQKSTGLFDVAYRASINEYGGRKRVEIQLVDWRPSQISGPAASVGTLQAPHLAKKRDSAATTT